MNIEQVIFLLATTVALANSCNIRQVENGFVCVCNSSYCDSVPDLEKLEQETFQLYSTSKSKPGFNIGSGKFSKDKDLLSSIIIINYTFHQTIFGFGGAFTDATGMNVRSLPEAAQRKLLESYFGKSGIEYSLCRVPIGGTDFSPRPYTYDDDHPDDTQLKYFELQQEDLTNKIPFIKEAKSLRDNNLKLFGSTWSPSVWMKTNNIFSGYAQLKEEYHQVYADYTVKFFEEYKKHDIDFWGVTTGNEPMNGFYSQSHSLINTVGWIPSAQVKWLKENLAPSIRSSPYKDLKIMIHDESRLSLPYVVPLMLEDEEALKYIDGIATHWYLDDQVPAEVLSFTKTDKKDVFLLSTEACIFREGGVLLGSWDRAARYIGSILEYLENGAVGWIDWNMALNMTGGFTYIDYLADSPIVVDHIAEEFFKQPMFYAMGHFSKFVVPGSVRLDVSIDQQENDNLKSLAFLRPDDLIALVVFNSGSTDASIQVENDNYYSHPIKVEANSIYTILFPVKAESKG